MDSSSGRSTMNAGLDARAPRRCHSSAIAASRAGFALCRGHGCSHARRLLVLPLHGRPTAYPIDPPRSASPPEQALEIAVDVIGPVTSPPSHHPCRQGVPATRPRRVNRSRTAFKNKIISDCDVSFPIRLSRLSDSQGIEGRITPLHVPDYCLRDLPAASSPQLLDISTRHIGFRCVVSL
jgi:hypothetical protein